MLRLNDNTKVFFTSDTHYGHSNIIDYCNRPYDSVEEMDEDLIKRHNAIVPPDGLTIHHGDFCFDGVSRWLNILGRLNGDKILVIGNHDEYKNRLMRKDLRAKFLDIKSSLVFQIADEHCDGGYRTIHANHMPYLAWARMEQGSWHTFGHMHGSLSNKPRSTSVLNPRQLDVGVDVWDGNPVSYAQVADAVEAAEMAEAVYQNRPIELC